MNQESPIGQFPRQRLATGQKNNDWFKKCIDAGANSAMYSSFTDQVRTRREEKILKSLSEGILDIGDVEKAVNDARVHNETIHKELQNFPLAKPRIDLLIGESISRSFDWVVRVVNDDAISDKEKGMKQKVMQEMVSLAGMEGLKDEELQAKLNELNRWMRYEYQDGRERLASHILKYLWEEQKLDIKFMQGMGDVLNIGKEAYVADIINNEPVLRRVDPLHITTVRSGSSDYIEDSDIIIEDRYRPLGYVIDTYSKWLKASDIDQLERAGIKDGKTDRNGIQTNKTYPVFPADMFADPTNNMDVIDFFSNTPNEADFGSYDPNGNVRETRVVWRGMRKIGVLKFYNEEGIPDERFVDEHYKANADAGEKIKWIWVTEWYEGTRLAGDIYVKMQPRPIQFRNMNHMGAGGSGYVGTVHPQSLLEILKPYQYLYVIIMDQVKRALKKYKGPRIELDIAKIPDDWKLDDWLYYAEEMGYLIVDSFKEGNKGSSQGKLAGNFNTTGKEYNSDMGNYVNQLLVMLEFIERQVSVASGVNNQRLGQIENRETVGGIERSVTQSSHITEPIFTMHDYTKIRAMELLLETAKYAWRNNKSKKAQYVLDDMSTTVLNIDNELFPEADYGLFVGNSTEDTELKSSMKQLSHAMAQNDRMNFRDLMTVLTSPSVSSMRRELERSDDERKQGEQQAAQAEQQAQQQALQAQMASEDKKLAVDEGNNMRDNETKLIIAQLGNDNETEQPVDNSTDEAKATLEKEKLSFQKDTKGKEFSLQKAKDAEVKRHNIATEAIQRKNKAATPKK